MDTNWRRVEAVLTSPIGSAAEAKRDQQQRWTPPRTEVIPDKRVCTVASIFINMAELSCVLWPQTGLFLVLKLLPWRAEQCFWFTVPGSKTPLGHSLGFCNQEKLLFPSANNLIKAWLSFCEWACRGFYLQSRQSAAPAVKDMAFKRFDPAAL